MNLTLVIRLCALVLFVLSGMMILVTAWSGYLLMIGQTEERDAFYALLGSSLAGGSVGGLILWLTRGCKKIFGRREALLLVTVSWLLGTLLASMPYYFWGIFEPIGEQAVAFRSLTNCYFEAMSGLTTTGATVLSNIGEVPRSLLLWRATTQWIGGIGIIVLFVAVLPSLGVGSKHLFRGEIPGPVSQGVRPHIRETAQLLCIIYLTLTFSLIALLWLFGMNLYEAVCHAFTTSSTAGFSTRDASLGAFGPGIQIITAIFMILAAVNFGLYYQITQGRWRRALADTEFRVFIGMIVTIFLLLLLTLLLSQTNVIATTGEPQVGFFGKALGAFYTTVAIGTTTGYASVDYDLWPFIAKAMILALMFVGGSSGSTAGGIKVIRVWIALKVMILELERAFRPSVIRPLKIGTTALDGDMRLGILAYVMGIIVLFVIGTCAIHLSDLNTPGADLVTVSAASIATLCNIGPGFGMVGPTQHFGWFSAPSKLFMCLLMLIGRLEVFPVILMLTPRFWRND